MASIKTAYGTSNQSITCTLASLANNSARASTAVDNTSNLFLDAIVQVQVTSGASGTSATGTVVVYAYGTTDGGTTYTGGVTGSDAAHTLTSPTNLRFLGTINVVANSTTYKGGPWSVASAFGGVLPASWGIVVENRSGGTLDATEGNHKKVYQGLFATSA